MEDALVWIRTAFVRRSFGTCGRRESSSPVSLSSLPASHISLPLLTAFTSSLTPSPSSPPPSPPSLPLSLTLSAPFIAAALCLESCFPELALPLAFEMVLICLPCLVGSSFLCLELRFPTNASGITFEGFLGRNLSRIRLTVCFFAPLLPLPLPLPWQFLPR